MRVIRYWQAKTLFAPMRLMPLCQAEKENAVAKIAERSIPPTRPRLHRSTEGPVIPSQKTITLP